MTINGTYEDRMNGFLEHARYVWSESSELRSAVEEFARWWRTCDEIQLGYFLKEHSLATALIAPETGLVARFRSLGDNKPSYGANANSGHSPSVVAGCTIELVTEYCRGRAAMRAVLSRPDGSNGLSLAYSSLSPSEYGLVAATGADDELADAIVTGGPTWNAACAEIKLEVGRLKLNPEKLAFNSGHNQDAIALRSAAEPISYEACAGWRIRDIPVETDFLRFDWDHLTI